MSEQVQDKAAIKNDKAIAAVTGFEQGAYPYAEKLGRSSYEDEKANLQIELLKASFGSNKRNKKLSSCLRVVTRRAKVEPSNDSLSILTPAQHGLSP